MRKALLLQLPVPGFRWPNLDANIPLAAGYLASWARGPAALRGWDFEILPWQEADVLGDEALLAAILSRAPDLVGLSLYLWNAERSVSLGRRLEEAEVFVAVGGPEAVPNNPWLREAGGFTAATSGEGEEVFAALLRSVAQGLDPGAVPGLFGPTRSSGSDTRAGHVDIARLPSPYLTGLLPPYPDGSVWIETLRGCPFRCTYCRYGKSRRTPRAFPAGWLEEHIAWAVKNGAREIYLMDPSFNVRSDWSATLRTLEEVGTAGGLAFHAELVADAIRPGEGARLARAGLASCEVGLQSIHPHVLAAVNRRWDRKRWIRGVQDLTGAGVRVAVGLIAGLPGDDLSGFSRSVDFLLQEVPQAEIQVFPLAVLPGTDLWANAQRWGIRALDRPPYTVVETRGFSEEDLQRCFDRFEEATGLELDPLGCPPLSGSWSADRDSVPYLTGVRLDAPRVPVGWVDAVARRAAENFAIWVRGWRETLPAEVGNLSGRLPNGISTVILEDDAGWPPSRLSDLIAAAGTGEHYLDRYFRLLYGPGSRILPRLVALVEEGPTAWVEEIRRHSDVVWKVDVDTVWREKAAAWAAEGEMVFVEGRPDLADLQGLARELGPDGIGLVFASAEAQAVWDGLLGSAGFRGSDYRVTLP